MAACGYKRISKYQRLNRYGKCLFLNSLFCLLHSMPEIRRNR